MTVERVVRATAATISFQGVDQYGEPANPGTVTIGVVDSQGNEVVASGTATTGTGTSPRTYALSVSNTANIDQLTATWTVSGVVVGTTKIDVVGGVYVDIATIRATEPALTSATDYPAASVRQARAEVEYMFEDACSRAFVPRFCVERLDGTGTPRLPLSYPSLRQVRWCRIYQSATSYITLSADQLAAIAGSEAGVAVRTDVDVWDVGTKNIEIGYVHGWDMPPPDLRRAAIMAVRHQLNQFKSGIDSRATSFQPIEGGNVILATPGVAQWHTGIPQVDEVLKRYRFHKPSVR